MDSSEEIFDDIKNKILPFEYNGKILGLKYEGEKTISGLCLLTRAGKELYGLVDNNYSQNFVEYLKEFYKKNELN